VCSSPAQVVCIAALAGGRLRANLPWIVLVATVTWLAASPAATAQADWVAERFKELDRNGDGRLTPAEVPYGNLLRQ